MGSQSDAVGADYMLFLEVFEGSDVKDESSGVASTSCVDSEEDISGYLGDIHPSCIQGQSLHHIFASFGRSSFCTSNWFSDHRAAVGAHANTAVFDCPQCKLIDSTEEQNLLSISGCKIIRVKRCGSSPILGTARANLR